jgi:hypothetical protein|tara:strand:- start:3780 stop:4187 length:408 start_codon:yes stop_codon:yes gene_type:complete
MDIKHPNIFEIDKVIEIYEKKDGVDIKYVCTTDLRASDLPADIFYRSTPHPEFGNRYFGLYKNHLGKLMITNADIVEDFEFGMIKSSDNEWYYSSSHHDCIFIEDKMIDGGRQYIRSSGLEDVFKIVDGEFVYEQ